MWAVCLWPPSCDVCACVLYRGLRRDMSLRAADGGSLHHRHARHLGHHPIQHDGLPLRQDRIHPPTAGEMSNVVWWPRRTIAFWARRDGDEAMLRCYAQKRDGDEAMLRCYGQKAHSIVTSLHRHRAFEHCIVTSQHSIVTSLHRHRVFEHSIVPSLHRHHVWLRTRWSFSAIILTHQWRDECEQQSGKSIAWRVRRLHRLQIMTRDTNGWCDWTDSNIKIHAEVQSARHIINQCMSLR